MEVSKMKRVNVKIETELDNIEFRGDSSPEEQANTIMSMLNRGKHEYKITFTPLPEAPYSVITNWEV